MNNGGIITIHDTDKNYVDNFVEIENHEDYDLTGPSEFIKTIDKVQNMMTLKFYQLFKEK